jgi:DNA-3-methyladenine glycosylase II
MQIYQYGEKEMEYLKTKDKLLGEVIDRIGFIERPIIPDLFAALINSIVGQQISMKAADTIWDRMREQFGDITAENIGAAAVEEIQQCGMSMRKAGYIKGVADTVLKGELNISELVDLPDDEVCKRLCSLKGIGIWTAEMLMIFSMERPDIVSWDDLAIRRGMMKLYRHRKLDKEKFNKYKRRYSPYGTIASFYLWKVSLEK